MGVKLLPIFDAHDGSNQRLFGPKGEGLRGVKEEENQMIKNLSTAFSSHENVKKKSVRREDG